MCNYFRDNYGLVNGKPNKTQMIAEKYKSYSCNKLMRVLRYFMVLNDDTLNSEIQFFAKLLRANIPTILAKSPGTLRKFLIFSQRSSPLPPNTMLVFGRSTSGNGKIFLYNNAMYLRNRPTLFWGERGGCVEATILKMIRKV